ncbi:MAG TPA: YraN family protein [Thermodesulfobacteriota bacterium]|nr:YraN family protein [Thermodesulfobacteriota bacterium]
MGGSVTDKDHGHEPRREKKDLGKKGEEKALRFLNKKGYRIIETNYVCKMGEMDLIAKEKDTLVFIEVKTRTSTMFGPPQLAVNSWKQRQLSKVALNFLKEKKLEDVKARFDVVAILLGQKGEEIELIKNAFDLNWP